MVGDCDRAFRWTSFLFHEVVLISAALKHFVENGFSGFCVKGVLQTVNILKTSKISLRMPGHTIIYLIQQSGNGKSNVK